MSTNERELPSSPFQSILHSNYVPTDSESATIRDFLVDPGKQLVDIQTELKRVQRVLKALAHRQDRLKKFINAHRALVSPMRRMPPEIVQNIFVATLPNGRNCAISKKEGPLLLGRVCKSWRAISQATPRLWASVHIVVPPPSHVEALAGWLQRVWLPRSGIRPLNVSVTHSESALALDQRALHCIYAVIVSEAQRWRDIELLFHSFEDIQHLSHKVNAAPLPYLRTLKLLSPLRRLIVEPEPEEDCLAFLANAPHLRSLTLPDLQPLYRSNALLWETLRHCTSLKSCDIVCRAADDFALEPEFEPFSLPLLQELSITHSRLPDGSPVHFFAPLELPNLRILKCYMQGIWESIGSAELTNLLPAAPSLHHVENLTIGINFLESEKLLRALELFPALQKLSILYEPKASIDEHQGALGIVLGPGAPQGDSAFLDKLERLMHRAAQTDNGDNPSPRLSPALFPSLQSISLLEFAALTDDTLAQFVRTCATRGLRKVECSFSRRRQRDIRPELHDVKKHAFE
ncbi:hypothetical protein C8F01DRAFT_1373895 [Mycena amicta]|nr:hypothetical protein C8F01DRAFT_1373895 [Mycena amicta]